jgi:dGTPase
VAALADDIAYDAHDIDDGLRAELFGFSDMSQVPVVGDILREIDKSYPDLESPRRAHELVRRLITRMIENVIEESRHRIDALKPRTMADVRAAQAPVIGFSSAMEQADKGIKGFLYPRMYHHSRVMRIMDEAESVVRDLFGHFIACADLPAGWSEKTSGNDEAGRMRRIADYIAGMTDRYALIEHAKYFKNTPELR